METLKIDLKAMTEDSMETSYVLDNNYFQSLDDAEIQHGKVSAALSIRKVANGDFTFSIGVEGSVTVECDLCLEDMDQPIEAQSNYIVKLGHEPSEMDDIIIVDENEGVLDTSWFIYEAIALAIPIKHVHAPGKCNDAMTRKLEELSATRSGDEIAEDTIDPRWEALSKLKD